MMDLNQRTVILKGMVGSKAYGLDHERSDEDFIGAFTYPSERFWIRPEGFAEQNDRSLTKVTKDPDTALHELTKVVKLVSGGNPSLTEMLFLPEYEVSTDVGQQLIDLGPHLITGDKVRKAYLGYAKDQAKRSVNREDGSYSSDTRKRTAKHTRHIVRLIWQAQQLLSEGRLDVKLNESQIEQCWEMSDWEPLQVYEWFEKQEDVIASIDSVLPVNVDWDYVNDVLISIRRNGLSNA